MADEKEFNVVAVSFFGKWSAGRFPTREQAEWRAKELNEWSERNPRGYIQYLIRPVEEPPEDEWAGHSHLQTSAKSYNL